MYQQEPSMTLATLFAFNSFSLLPQQEVCIVNTVKPSLHVSVLFLGSAVRIASGADLG